MPTERQSLPAACEFFEFIGARTCDRCGRLANEHKGYRTLKEGVSPFNKDVWENLTWAEWDERLATKRRLTAAREKLDALPAETVIALVEGLSGMRPKTTPAGGVVGTHLAPYGVRVLGSPLPHFDAD